MAEKIISSGNIVYGVAYSQNFRNAEYIRVTCIDELELLKGSKYIKAFLNNSILNTIVSDLKSGKIVLFIGLPCDVYVVKTHLKKLNISTEHLLCVDLICHGPTYSEIAKEFIDDLEKKYKSKIIKFSVRYKNPYWKPPYLYAQFENKKEYIKPFYSTSYGTAFMMMSWNSCYDCHFKGNNYMSDITIGDYWGSQEGDNGYNVFGSSVAFIHTNEGDEFISSLDNFNIYDANTKKALEFNPRYTTPTKKTEKAIIFRNNFKKKGLKYAIRKNMTPKHKIAFLLKCLKTYFHK